ncbi:MAG: hypothetical protein D3910_21890 [Candidatus Electrothrix sp. ATG2]|nr:hypothetical protein [Candidatus Electrothrix sp. ATG2]
MWDGLLDLLYEWFETVWCWVLEQIMQFGVNTLKIIASIFPNYEVPSFLASFNFDSVTLSVIALFFPFDMFTLLLGVWLTIEIIGAFLIPLSRTIYDLVP